MPLYNEKELVHDLIDHVDRLTGIDEVLLVDASDQPDSIHVMRQLEGRGLLPPYCKVLFSHRPSRSLQMNLGARFSTQPILLFLHCDTRLPADAARLIATALNDQVCWGRFTVRLDATGLCYRLLGAMINLRSRVRKLATGDQALFVRRVQFDAVGGFPEIPLMEDIALSRSLSALSRPSLIKRPVVTSARRWKQDGVITTILLMWRLRWLFWLGAAPEKLARMYRDAR